MLIKQICKNFIGFLFYYSGLFFLMRRIVSSKRVTTLVYHNPKPDAFERHMAYFSKYYNFIPLEQLIKAIELKDRSLIPPYSLVVTIDDGYKENFQLLPAIKKYKFRPTVYLCSHIIDSNRKFWFDSGLKDVEELKYCQNGERLDALKTVVAFAPEREYVRRQAMNAEEIEQMKPFVDFQSHSKFHPILTSCSSIESYREIEESKKYLETMLQNTVDHFSYPSGRYTDREKHCLVMSGYRSGRTCDVGWNDIYSDPYQLKSIPIDDQAPTNLLSAHVCGLFAYFRYLCKGNIKGEHQQ